MMKFGDYLTEAADSAQNLHMTHADEDIFERGDVGAKAAIDFINDFITNVGTGSTKITVKWDGAPAIFAGWDPEDGKFFVGTKSVFSKNPKLYKTVQDINANESNAGKISKLTVALEEMSKIGIPKDTVLQGDFLWGPGDFRYETIDGKRWLTVHPNTIIYAWPSESDIAKKMTQSRMGIVFHTTYKGKGSLANYRSTFGANVSKLKRTRGCWFDDAFYKGSDIAFTDAEFKEIQQYTKKAMSVVGGFDRIVSIMSTLPSSAAGANIKTFINGYIRKGRYPDPSTAYDAYVKYLKSYWEDKVISKVKTDKSKDQKRAALNQLLTELNTNKATFVKSFQYVHDITKAKMLVISKINSLIKDKMFVKTNDGFKVVAHEGFVAIDSRKGEAVKFVDRLEFSYNNFSDQIVKGWQR